MLRRLSLLALATVAVHAQVAGHVLAQPAVDASTSEAASEGTLPEPGPTPWWKRKAKPKRIFRRTAVLYAATTVAFSPIVEPSRVQRAIGGLLDLAPPLRSAVMAACRALYGLREAHTIEILLAHEVFTDVSADIIAQAIAADSDGSTAIAVDWPRVPRSAAASLISDDIPFLLWSKYLWELGERIIGRLRDSDLARSSPVLVARLTHPVSVTLLKTAVTQLVYETTSNAVYLALQAAMRRGKPGETRLKRIVAELRGKLFGVWRDGLIFWSAAHIVVFAMPIWWLQPIMDNLFTLMFNTYLAITAYS
jgi:hypothetical protein|eukprot:5088166-Prymnesium_polylepis.2